MDFERRNEIYHIVYSSIANGDENVAAAIFRRSRNGDDAHRILEFLPSGDPKAAFHLNSHVKFCQALVYSLMSSTAPLQEIIDCIDTSSHEIPMTAPPMDGMFEPLRDRTIDLAILRQVLERQQHRPLDDARRRGEAQETHLISAATSSSKT